MTDIATPITKGDVDLAVWKLKAIAKQLHEHYTDKIELREQMAGDVERAAKLFEGVLALPTGEVTALPTGEVTALIEESREAIAERYQSDIEDGRDKAVAGDELLVRLTDALARFSAPKLALTDNQIIAIRDEHLPSQGESFDCIAFARAILNAGE